jgi:hypothetical protein
MACARPLSRRLTMADVDPAHPLCQLCKAAKEYDADIDIPPGRTIHNVVQNGFCFKICAARTSC